MRIKFILNKFIYLILLFIFISPVFASEVDISSPTAINPNTISRSVPNGVIYNPNVVNNPYMLRTVNPYGTPTHSQPGINADPADYEIAINVQTQLTQASDLGGANITVTCQQGIVTLRGTVPILSKASRAVKIASQVPGVKGVNSKITVDYGTGYQ